MFDLEKLLTEMLERSRTPGAPAVASMLRKGYFGRAVTALEHLLREAPVGHSGVKVSDGERLDLVEELAPKLIEGIAQEGRLRAVRELFAMMPEGEFFRVIDALAVSRRRESGLREAVVRYLRWLAESEQVTECGPTGTVWLQTAANDIEHGEHLKVMG